LKPVLPKTVTKGTGDVARMVTNPAYTQWQALDQKVLSHLYGSMTEEIST
jgi:hypothetical protein